MRWISLVLLLSLCYFGFGDQPNSIQGIGEEDKVKQVEEAIEPYLLIDPVPHKVSIHFETRKILPNDHSIIEKVQIDSVQFNCQIPTNKRSLHVVYPTTHSETNLSRIFNRTQRISLLSEEDFESVADHFSILKNRCHLDLAYTTGTEYMYQLCFGSAFKRGDVKKLAADPTKGTTELTWQNTKIISTPYPDDLDWWGIVENDEVALELTGFSTYFYQYYGDNVIVHYYCSDKPRFVFVDEPERGKFIVGFGSPLVCSHIYIQRSRNFLRHIHCYLDETESAYSNSEVEGVWKIFQGGQNQNQYSGALEITKFQYFEWPEVFEMIPEKEFVVHEPVFYYLHWELDSHEAYSGFGLFADDHLCATWTSSSITESPGIAVFSENINGGIEGYWWSTDAYGFDEATLISSDDSNDDFVGEYAVIRNIVGLEEEQSSFYGTLKVNYNMALDSYSLLWDIKGVGYFSGKGVLSGNQLCVNWREKSKVKPNDGTVTYKMNGDRAYGRWSLSGNHRVQKEDLIRGKTQNNKNNED